MGTATKRGVGFYLDAVGIVLAVAGLVVTVISSTMSADNALPSLPMYVAGIVAGIVLAALSVVFGGKKGDTSVVSLLTCAAAVFLLAFVAISVIGSRVLLASGLLTWNASNTVGWSVFYVSVAATICLIVSALFLVVGAFAPTSKEA